MIATGRLGPVMLAGTVAVTGCATSQYAPQVVARGELVLRYDDGFQMWAGGRQVAHGLQYHGLARFVRCVPEAERHARIARRNGEAALALSIIGGVLGGAALAGFYGFADKDHEWTWLGAGIGSAVAGTVFAGFGRLLKNSANGHAVDALDYYNDAVGSLGASCDDLTYPPPAGPAP